MKIRNTVRPHRARLIANTVTQMPETAVLRMHEVAEQDRQHQHETVHDRHHDRRPASLQGPRRSDTIAAVRA